MHLYPLFWIFQQQQKNITGSQYFFERKFIYIVIYLHNCKLTSSGKSELQEFSALLYLQTCKILDHIKLKHLKRIESRSGHIKGKIISNHLDWTQVFKNKEVITMLSVRLKTFYNNNDDDDKDKNRNNRTVNKHYFNIILISLVFPYWTPISVGSKVSNYFALWWSLLY